MELPRGLELEGHFAGFLRGVQRLHFLRKGEEAASVADAYWDTFPEEDEEEPALSMQGFEAFAQEVAELLQDAASNNWSESDMESFLTEETTLPEAHARLVAAFWNREKENVRAAVVQGLRWGRELSKVGWRVDLQMHARNVSDINRPCAVVELSTSKGGAGESTVFEVEKETLSGVVKQLDKIDQEIERLVEGKN